MDKNKLVAKKVVALLKKIGGSHDEIAKKLNVSLKSFHRWRLGTCTPSAFSLMCLYRLAEGRSLDFDSEDVFLFWTSLSFLDFKQFYFRLLYVIIEI